MDEKREYRFTIIIETCEEGGYFAMCPAFPGCHVEGETYEETLSEMRAAIDAFIEEITKQKASQFQMMNLQLQLSK